MAYGDDVVRRMWPTSTISEIAVAIGMSSTTVCRAAKRLELPRKIVRDEDRDSPSEKEIEVRSAEVRAGWTKSEERRRRVGWSSEAYTVPCLTNRQVFPAFQGQGRN